MEYSCNTEVVDGPSEGVVYEARDGVKAGGHDGVIG